MSKNNHQHKAGERHKQAGSVEPAEPGKGLGYEIGSATRFDFRGRNLTPFGGLLPVATMLDKLGFQQLLAECVPVRRATRVMAAYQFVLAMVLGMYIGLARLHQLRFVAFDPILRGILKIDHLPAQSTFWRFLASWHSSVATRLVRLQQLMRKRVWASAHVRLRQITVDTDTTVHTLYGRQMGAA